MGVAFDTCVRSRCTLSPKVARRCVRENSTFRARWTMVKVRDKDAKRHDCNTLLFSSSQVTDLHLVSSHVSTSSLQVSTSFPQVKSVFCTCEISAPESFSTLYSTSSSPRIYRSQRARIPVLASRPFSKTHLTRVLLLSSERRA
jgi:hypothetical protein